MRCSAWRVLLCAPLALMACGGEPSAPNTPPVAAAGSDQDVNRGDVVALTGSATDPDGQSLTITPSVSRLVRSFLNAR